MAATQSTMSTKISKRSNSRFRTTLPRGLAHELELYDREDPKVHFEIQCHDSSVALALTLGPEIDGSGSNVMSPVIHSTGQVELEIPRFQAEAWNLEDVEVEWPDPEEIDVDDDGSATIVAPLPDWEPKYDVDMFEASGGFAYKSTISKSGDKRTNVESHFPITLAEEVGLAESQQRAELTFDCVDGRKVMVATPTTEAREDLRNSVSVSLAGANNRQARFTAGRVADEFGISSTLEAGDSVRLRWFSQHGDQLVAFTRPEGGEE